MGSWANSLHVKHEDPTIVQNAIRTLLLGQGYREQAVQRSKLGSVVTALGPPDEESSSDDFDADWREGEGESDDGGPADRGICVFRTRPGWVGVLDSGEVWELGALLSAHLRTDTLSVLVNDSDSWWYQIHRNGTAFDEFDSMGTCADGTSPDDGSISPEMQAAMESEDEEAIERELLKHAPKGPIFMPGGDAMFPPELALLRQRAQAGQAGFLQRCRYWWLLCKFWFQVLTGRWQPHPIDIGFDIPRSTPLDAETLSRHIEKLQAVFAGAQAKALRDLLPLNRFPAEELLREFLETVNLPGFFAYLSYAYLEEHSAGELAEQGIHLVGEMRFTKGVEL
jgi:hypothetical protein